MFSVSDFDTSEFGYWDADSSSFYSTAEPSYRPQLGQRSRPLPSLEEHHASLPFSVPLPRSPAQSLPPSSPPRHSLSPVGFRLSPIEEVIQQVASPQAPSAVSSPVPERSPTPELRYPSPAPLPASPPSVRLVSPVFVRGPTLSPSPFFHPPSAPANTPIPRIRTPDLQPLAPRTPTPHPPTPDSPIDYERAALRVKFYKANPLVPDPDQENVPLAPIIRPPSCLRDTTVHPHQHLAIWTPRGEEIIPIGETHQFSINILRPIGDLSRRPPRFPGVTPFCIPSPHCISIYPSNYTAALAVGVQPLYTCSKVILICPAKTSHWAQSGTVSGKGSGTLSPPSIASS